jgi:hypothetical protein
MRIVAFLTAIAMAVSMSNGAIAQSKPKKAKAVAAKPVDPNENGMRFMRDSLPLFLPSGLFVAYMLYDRQQKAQQPKAKKK